MKTCANCGEQLDDQAVVCSKCGATQQTATATQPAPTAAQPTQPVPPTPQQPGAQPNPNMYTQPNPNMYTQPNPNMYPPNNMYQPIQPAVNDSGSFGWAVLGFFIPLVGLILFLAWKDSKPLCAKKAGVGALVSVILNVVLGILMVIVGAAAGASMYYY